MAKAPYRLAIAFSIAASGSSVAHGQAYQCRLPDRLTIPKIERDEPTRRMPVNGYTLALSWAPEFCKPRADQQAHAVQCSGRNGRFGMVVHGLWPQGRQGWPQWCPTPRTLQLPEVRRNLCMTPSARLQARQWAKHGACMVRSPEKYFKVTRILWNSLRMPDFDRLSREDDLTAGRIRTRFATANPGFMAEAVGVKLNARGWLQELRLCYGKDFRPTRCDSRRFGPTDGTRLKIWRGL